MGDKAITQREWIFRMITSVLAKHNYPLDKFRGTWFSMAGKRYTEEGKIKDEMIALLESSILDGSCPSSEKTRANRYDLHNYALRILAERLKKDIRLNSFGDGDLISNLQKLDELNKDMPGHEAIIMKEKERLKASKILLKAHQEKTINLLDLPDEFFKQLVLSDKEIVSLKGT